LASAARDVAAARPIAPVKTSARRVIIIVQSSRRRACKLSKVRRMTPRDGRIHNGESTGGKLPQT
jgi:hypothetical protein